MFKKISCLSHIVIVFLLLLGNINILNAQTLNEDQNQQTSNQQQEKQLEAVAGEDKNVVVGRQVLFSGVNSVNPTEKSLKYFWDLGDGIKLQGEEVSHIYSQPGIYRVVLTVEDAFSNTDSDEIIVSVDKDIIILVADKNANLSEITNLQRYASTQEILLVVVRNDKNEPDYVISKELARQLVEAKDDIRQASSIVLWTSGSIGINAMLEVGQTLITDEKTDFRFNNKNIISITDKSFSATARIAQNVYNALGPKNVILTTNNALQIVVGTVETNELIENLKENNNKYQIVGVHTKRAVEKLGPFNFLSVAVNYMVNKGVSLNSIYLILMLPIIATIISFARQVIGIKAFGIYIPSIIALSFLSIGLRYGIIIFLVIIFSGTLARFLARKIKILYLPRMAIVLITVSLFIFLLFLAGTALNQPGIITVSVFPILIMTFVTEKFIAAQIEQGTKTAIFLSVQTLVLSILCYFVANWKELEILILGYPELILITILINIIIGRFSGLRVVEYFRFKNLFKNA